MNNPLFLVRSLDSPSATPRPKLQKLKPRRQRRQEMRDRIRTAKVNSHRKAG
jgi:hypothetical protein